jgi:hypothetical protein
MSENLEISDYNQEYTYESLKEIVDNHWNSMSEEERMWRTGHVSGFLEPTFHQYVLYSTKPGDKIIINEHTKQFKVVK